MEQHPELVGKLGLEMGESSVLVPQQRSGCSKSRCSCYWTQISTLGQPPSLPRVITGLSQPPTSTSPTADPLLAFPGDSTQLAGSRGCTCAPGREEGQVKGLSCRDSYRWWFCVSGEEIQVLNSKNIRSSHRGASQSAPRKWVAKPTAQAAGLRGPFPGLAWGLLLLPWLAEPGLAFSPEASLPARARAVLSGCGDSPSSKLEALRFRLLKKNPCYIKRKKNGRLCYVPSS